MRTVVGSLTQTPSSECHAIAFVTDVPANKVAENFSQEALTLSLAILSRTTLHGRERRNYEAIATRIRQAAIYKMMLAQEDQTLDCCCDTITSSGQFRNLLSTQPMSSVIAAKPRKCHQRPCTSDFPHRESPSHKSEF